MPSEPNADQAEIRRKGRQRLVGAVVLALLAVVFVPMALDPEPRRDRPEPALAIPPKDSPPVASALVPVAPAKTAGPAATPEAKPAEAPKADAPATSEAAPAPPKAPATAAVKTIEPRPAELKPASKPAPAETKPATPSKAEAAAVPKLEGFAVQVGAFRDEAKLQQVRDKLKSARISHYTERIEAEGGPLTRVRAGPYPTREAAEKAAAAIKKAGVDGRVVPLP